MVTFLCDFTAAGSESSHYLHFYTLRHFTADLQLPFKSPFDTAFDTKKFIYLQLDGQLE